MRPLFKQAHRRIAALVDAGVWSAAIEVFGWIEDVVHTTGFLISNRMYCTHASGAIGIYGAHTDYPMA